MRTLQEVGKNRLISRNCFCVNRQLYYCVHHGSPGGGEGREPPGTHGARHRPGVSPGSGLTETATGPGSTLTARGGAYSLWLQRFAVLKLQKLQLLHRRAAGVFPDLEHDISITEVNLLQIC